MSPFASPMTQSLMRLALGSEVHSETTLRKAPRPVKLSIHEWFLHFLLACEGLRDELIPAAHQRWVKVLIYQRRNTARVS